jgi:DNA-binding CsgD family transcriptional regulator
MPLLYLAYWGLAYTVGLICLAGMGLLFIRDRRGQDLWLFFFMASMTLASVALSLRECLPANEAIPSWPGFLALAGAALCAATFPRFAAAQENARSRERLARGLSWIGLCLAALDLALPLLPIRWMTDLAGGLSVVALVIAVYLSLAWIYRAGRLKKGDKGLRPRGHRAPLAFAVFMALVVSLDFFGGAGRLWPSLAGHFLLFPSLYASLAVFLIVNKLRVLASRGQGEGQQAGYKGEDGPGSRREAMARYRISEREAEVLALLAKGYTYREIADELFVSLSTVKSHVAHLFNKTGARNKVELINLTE